MTLEIIKVLADRDARDAEGIREFFDEHTAMLLSQLDDVLATFLDQHLGTTFNAWKQFVFCLNGRFSWWHLRSKYVQFCSTKRTLMLI